MNKQESKFQKGFRIYRRISLVVGLIFTVAILIFSWMVKSGMNVGQYPTRPSTTASSVAVEQTTEEVTTETTQSAEGVMGSDGIFQEKGKRYVYEYALGGKTLHVVEVDSLPIEIIGWEEDMKPEEFDEILNSPETKKAFLRIEE